MGIYWTSQLVEQLEWHWQGHVRPRLSGLTDHEYFWEPAPHTWSVRPRGASNAPVQAGSGDFTIDFAFPEPDPPPVTTIAWRLAHIIVGVFGARAGSHFGGAPMDYQGHAYAGTAADALRQLDETHDAWITGVRGLDEAALERAVGPAEGPFAERPMAELVLHINREAIHHGAEILLLRDLYRARATG
jgi:DinB superfamily